jgi:hypothetical protein
MTWLKRIPVPKLILTGDLSDIVSMIKVFTGQMSNAEIGALGEQRAIHDIVDSGGNVRVQQTGTGVAEAGSEETKNWWRRWTGR